MGYKLLGFIVWRGAKWYLRRQVPGLGRKAAVGGAGAVVLAALAIGAGAALRGQGESDPTS